MGKVAVHGSYHADNFGDTLLVRLICDMLAEHVGRENVALAMPGQPDEQAAIGYPVLAPEERGEVDLLVYGGGGYFSQHAGNLLRTVRATRRRNRRHLDWLPQFAGSRKAMIGVGVGPISFHRAPVRKLFTACETVLVRDAESMAFCKDYGFRTRDLRQCVDLALSLPVVPGPRSGVAIHLPGMSPEVVETALSVLAAHPLGKSERIEAIFDAPPTEGLETWTADLQRIAQAKLGRKLPIFPYPGVDVLREKLGGYELVITCKLHVGIVTIAQGGKVVSVAQQSKTPRLYRQLGLEEFCVPLAQLSPARLTAAFDRLPEFTVRRDVIDQGIGVIRDTVAKLVRTAA